MPEAFVNRLVTFGVEGIYGVTNAFLDACTAAEDAFNVTLDIPLFRIMRRSWTTVDNTPLVEQVHGTPGPLNNQAHELDNEEADSNQATNTSRLNSEVEINMNSDYMLNADLVPPSQNRVYEQPCWVENSQRERDDSTFGEAAASFRHTCM